MRLETLQLFNIKREKAFFSNQMATNLVSRKAKFGNFKNAVFLKNEHLNWFALICWFQFTVSPIGAPALEDWTLTETQNNFNTFNKLYYLEGSNPPNCFT